MNILTLAIETSCDETSVAVMQNGRIIKSNVISSQIETHRIFGGVVPEVASRLHLEMINEIIETAIKEADISLNDIDHIAVTCGPGLIGALIVGVSAAKALALSLDIPLNGVNHMQGHVCANYIAHPSLKPPFIALIVSGGHSYLLEVISYTEYIIRGQTRDDAAGECYDKVARTLGLSYPGGPEIDRLAAIGDPESIDFPRVMLEPGSYDFSFSGLKTAVLNYINQMKQKGEEIVKEDVAASFQQAVIDVMVVKSFRLLSESKYKTLVVSGGVAANKGLRAALQNRANDEGVELYFPPTSLCTDNAAMIGCAGYYDYIAGKRSDLDLNVFPNLKL